MSTSPICFNNVSKRFTLHRDRPHSFQEMFLFWRRYRRRATDKFWVLQDVSFDVAAGETLGIIGSNGAGKSTILKLIAGIIYPTRGQVTVLGRVSSLLELGAGFHPDLTGRENIFLYGSLLGLRRSTMRRCFDEIVQFSELKQFIDVPVKTYSSGMYLRLAFSVAIHVNPDVLLIDEILAVGDQSFRAKCLERLDTLQNAQVTILLVSHDVDSVRRLCTRAIWMEDGKIVAMGDTQLVVRQYLNAVARAQSRTLAVRNLTATARGSADQEVEKRQHQRWGSGEVEITRVRLLDDAGQERFVFVTDERLTIRMHYQTAMPVENPVFGLALHRSDGLHITGPNTQFDNFVIPLIEGEGVITYTIPRLPLLPGHYQISVAVCDAADERMFDYHDRLYTFFVNPEDTGERYGLMRLGGRWRHADS